MRGRIGILWVTALVIARDGTAGAGSGLAVPPVMARAGRLVWAPPGDILEAHQASEGPSSVVVSRTWTRGRRPWVRVDWGAPETPRDLGPLGTGRVWWVPAGAIVPSALSPPAGTGRPLRSPWGARLVRLGLLEAQGSVADAPDRLVILGQDHLREALDPLMAYRSRQGLQVEWVPVSAIGTDAVAIQAFLRSLARSDWPPVGVVLVGDAPGLPPPRTADGSASDWTLALPEEGAWLAAFPISRMPARTVDDVRTMVARTLAWERDVASGPGGQWTARSVLVSSSEGAGGLDDDQVCELLAARLLEADQEVPDRLFRSLGTDRTDRLLQAMDEGRGLVAYLGHGSGFSWATMDPPFDVGAAAALTNTGRTPLVLDVSCANGRFDLDESLAETLLHLGTPDAPAGAVAVISATGDTPWDEPAELARRVLEALVSCHRPLVGEALEQARVALVADLGPTPEVREVLEKTVLLGDLRVPFRTRAPALMFVQAPDQGVPGDTWTVRVRQGPFPLPGVSLGLVAAGHDPRRQVSDAAGIATFPLDGGIGGLAWTASGPDRVPQEGVVAVAADPCGVLEADPPVMPCVGRVALRLRGWAGPDAPVVRVWDGDASWPVAMRVAALGEWSGTLALGPGAFRSAGPIRVSLEGCAGRARDFPRDCEAPGVKAAGWRAMDARRVEWTVDLDEEGAGEAGVGPLPGVETVRRRDQGRWLRFVFPDREPGEESFLTLRVWDRAGNQRILAGPEWSFRVPPCTPDCAGRTCGEDGCGGTCGPGCEGGQSCREGRCTGGAGCAWWYLPGGGAQCEACVCQGAPYCCTDRWDEACSWRCEALCGGCGTGCVPSCEGRECGDNGCGGACGNCPPGRTCSPEGHCLPACLPSCAGRQCGDDGCGGSCGLCQDPQTGAFRDDGCREGRCVLPPPIGPWDGFFETVRASGIGLAPGRVGGASLDTPEAADADPWEADDQAVEADAQEDLSPEAREGPSDGGSEETLARRPSSGCQGGPGGLLGWSQWIAVWLLARRRRGR